MSGRIEIDYEVGELNWRHDVDKPTKRQTLRTTVLFSWFFFFVFVSFSFFTFTAKAVSLPSHAHYTWISKAVLSNMVLILCGRQSVLHCHRMNGPRIWLESYHAWLLYPNEHRVLSLRTLRILSFVTKRNTCFGASLSMEKPKLWHLVTVKRSRSTAVMFRKCTSPKIFHEFVHSSAFLAILMNCRFPLRTLVFFAEVD